MAKKKQAKRPTLADLNRRFDSYVISVENSFTQLMSRVGKLEHYHNNLVSSHQELKKSVQPLIVFSDTQATIIKDIQNLFTQVHSAHEKISSLEDLIKNNSGALRQKQMLLEQADRDLSNAIGGLKAQLDSIQNAAAKGPDQPTHSKPGQILQKHRERVMLMNALMQEVLLKEFMAATGLQPHQITLIQKQTPDGFSWHYEARK